MLTAFVGREKSDMLGAELSGAVEVSPNWRPLPASDRFGVVHIVTYAGIGCLAGANHDVSSEIRDQSNSLFMEIIGTRIPSLWRISFATQP